MPKPDAIPMPELFARATGKIQFTCPNCGQEHPFKHIQWRRADFKCQRCKALYQIGLGFHYSAGPEAYLMGKANKFTVNKFNPIGTAYDGVKIYGNVEWECPNCQRPQLGALDDRSCLECSGCGKPFFISALVYRFPGYKLTLKAPLDSIVRGLHNVQTVQPISDSQVDQSSRTSSEGAGDNS